MDTSEFLEKRAESKKIKAMPNPDTKSQDFGRTIFPSINLAMAQKITQAVNPKTKRRPFEVSTGMLVKGKQNNGNNTTTKNNDKNESLLNMFVRMESIILFINNQMQAKS
jgi:hypothetical protein